MARRIGPLAIESASETEVAWAAGLFEGEGWITLSHPNSGAPHANLGLSSTDEDVMRRFGRIIGARVTGPHAKSGPWNFKPYWHCHVSRHDDVGLVLRIFWPWLGSRRRARAVEVRDATHVFATYGPKKSPWHLPPTIQEEC